MRNIVPYSGPMDTLKMKPLALKAARIFYAQRGRCNNSKNKGYPDYGAKGIRVLYTSREFVGWYLSNFKKGSWKKPSVNRKNSKKNYCFENIEIIELSENVRLRNLEWGNPGKKHRKVVATAGKRKRIFASKVAAAKHYGVSEKTVYNHCERRTTQPFKFGPKFGTNREHLTFRWFK